MKNLVTTKEIFSKAYHEHYAVGAFNVNHMELIQAVVGAAAELRSAVILQASSFTAKYTDLGYLVAAADYAAKLAGVPVALHLDHGENFEVARQFIEAGFTSVMIDGSHLPYEENIAVTKEVCDYAHARGIPVEGELGTISGVEDGTSSEKILYTDPLQAKDFVERTGVDSLAVAIGTSHGAYKPFVLTAAHNASRTRTWRDLSGGASIEKMVEDARTGGKFFRLLLDKTSNR